MDMFCYQCQETARNQGCTVKGVCGKTAEVACLQDLLVWLLKGLSLFGVRARELDMRDRDAEAFVAQALFATITNVNFDAGRFEALIAEAADRRDALCERVRATCQGSRDKDCCEGLPGCATWSPGGASREELAGKGAAVGILADPDLDEDVRSLRELIVYGLKGIAAYTDHAMVLGHEDPEVLAFLQEGLAATLDDGLDAAALTALVERCGAMGVKAMALLDAANTGAYGHPEPTEAELGVREGPGILVSGHDLKDLDELLEQTAGRGVNVYTHGEMLPAQAYPAFRRHPHFAGNYGGSWWHQAEEFERFGGPILMTTNCIVPPRDSYKDRLYTTGLAGWPGCPHVADRSPGGAKDFTALVERALSLPGPEELETGTIPVGWAHEAVLARADDIVAAIGRGEIRRFVVMGGCDGRHRSREYFTEVARNLPADHVILTAGCAKYRYNKLDLGTVAGIPRILDAGQCNDSYSLVVVAMKLAEAVGAADVNELPISYDIAWYEQKAVIVLLALLSLGVRNIRLGPTLPAFLSPGVAKVLVERFDLKPTGEVEADLAAIAAGA